MDLWYATTAYTRSCMVITIMAMGTMTTTMDTSVFPDTSAFVTFCKSEILHTHSNVCWIRKKEFASFGVYLFVSIFPIPALSCSCPFMCHCVAVCFGTSKAHQSFCSGYIQCILNVYTLIRRGTGRKWLAIMSMARDIRGPKNAYKNAYKLGQYQSPCAPCVLYKWTPQRRYSARRFSCTRWIFFGDCVVCRLGPARDHACNVSSQERRVSADGDTRFEVFRISFQFFCLLPTRHLPCCRCRSLPVRSEALSTFRG